MKVIMEYDAAGRMIHSRASDGYERWYDAAGRMIHYRNPSGYEWWYDAPPDERRRV